MFCIYFDIGVGMLTKPSKYNRKAQSAMEYLMTYGWAILIIAVVLGALFSLGVFNGQNFVSACVASSGYLCQSPTYSHTTGQLLVSVGQNTGTAWTAANFVFVPQGSAVTAGVPTPLFAANTNVNTNALYKGTSLSTGQTLVLSLPVNGVSTNSMAALATPLAIGTSATGTVWVQYQTSSGGPLQYAQIATINVKAS